MKTKNLLIALIGFSASFGTASITSLYSNFDLITKVALIGLSFFASIVWLINYFGQSVELDRLFKLVNLIAYSSKGTGIVFNEVFPKISKLATERFGAKLVSFKQLGPGFKVRLTLLNAIDNGDVMGYMYLNESQFLSLATDFKKNYKKIFFKHKERNWNQQIERIKLIALDFYEFTIYQDSINRTLEITPLPKQLNQKPVLFNEEELIRIFKKTPFDRDNEIIKKISKEHNKR